MYLFDAGNGVQRQLKKAGLSEAKIKGVFLTHHHLDHNADLGPLLMTHWTFYPGTLQVFGPEGTKHLADHIALANSVTMLAGYPTGGVVKPDISETYEASDIAVNYEAETLVYEDSNIRVTAIKADHYQSKPSQSLEVMPVALSYKIKTAERTIVYTGDTGPSEALERFVSDADLLVTEIVNLQGIETQLTKFMGENGKKVIDGIVKGMAVNHITGDYIGKIASEGKVRSVVLTHFVPSPEAVSHPEEFATSVMKNFKGNVSVAKDLQEF
ncbi:MAG: hypothetical protein CL587_14510 [Alteromonadaceae bacterium]|nr:hypothetical protein [Alteromonadaceae bacterium]